MAKHEPMSREEIKAPIIAGRGVKVGGGVEGKRGEWRCKVCKFKNDDDEACKMCKEPKQVLKESPAVLNRP